MARTSQDITESELSVLQVLWDEGTATIRQITDVLPAGNRSAHYATVQKLLERLETKGYVRRDRSNPIHVFAATIGRDELIGRRLQSVAEQLCGGSWVPLLTSLVQTKKLSDQDRQQLHSLIEQLDQDKQTKSKRKGS